MPIRPSAEAEGVTVRPPAAGELPFAFDEAMKQAMAAEAEGSLLDAAGIYDALRRNGPNRLWAAEAAAAALYHDPARTRQALETCGRINRRQPTVSTLLLEARLCRRNHRVEEAAKLLERARGILDWTMEGKPTPC